MPIKLKQLKLKEKFFSFLNNPCQNQTKAFFKKKKKMFGNLTKTIKENSILSRIRPYNTDIRHKRKSAYNFLAANTMRQILNEFPKPCRKLDNKRYK